jgi:glycosyltransferase involved in cell wall biosynthesis
MKIAYVTNYYYPAIGGVNQVVQELAERYAGAGHEVHVFTSDWDKKERVRVKEEMINGVHVHRLFHILRVANFEVIWPSILWRLSSEKFDVIHSHEYGHLSTFLASIVSIIKKTPHIHTTHCPWSDAYRSPIGRIGLWLSYNIFTRAVISSIDKIIAITPWEHSYLLRYGANKQQIIDLPNGTNILPKVASNDFKKKLGLNKKVVLFFGRYSPTKKPSDFVRMAKKIIAKRKDVDFVMIGPDEGEFSRVTKEAKSEKRIKVLGPLRDKKEIAKMYQASDVYVLPSYREGLPLTIFEAMAYGLPIVATPVNGVPYEVKNNVNGFLVSVGDIDGFVQAVEKILDHPSLAKKFAANNIKKAKNYTWDRIARKTMDLYKRVSLAKK